MSRKREVRIRQLPNRFINGAWQTKPQPIVKLGDVGRWAMVRHAEHPQAMPFVVSLKDWDRMPVEESK